MSFQAKNHFIVFSILILVFYSSCSSDEGSNPVPIEPDLGTIVFPEIEADSVVLLNVNGDIVPVYLSVPETCYESSCPAVVIMHGSGGLWKSDDREGEELVRQYREWRDILNENGYIGAFVDSYTPRGCIERTGDWKEAPKAFQISSQFVRPHDAYSTLSWLRSLRTIEGNNLIQAQNVGIMGFSDGATALAATLYDTDKTPENWEWTQKYDKEYTQSDGILSPAVRPEDGGFKSGVFYYGGSVGNSYWGGNPCTNPDFMYVNYAPILYQLPELGYLTENTLCAIDHLEMINAPIEKYIYDDATHGFDGNDEDEITQRDLGRQRTLDWFKRYLR